MTLIINFLITENKFHYIGLLTYALSPNVWNIFFSFYETMFETSYWYIGIFI